jgi:hypothetical protein
MNDLSEIDENLDWNYTNNPDELYYLIKNGNRISISIKNKNSKADILCTKTNLASGRTTNMNNYCSKGHNSDKLVQKEIERIIKENN